VVNASYDKEGKLTAAVYKWDGHTESFADFVYEYDLLGNRTKETTTASGDFEY
jgi:hypothetical protein